MNRLLIILLVGAVILSGCVSQPTTQTTTTTQTFPTSSQVQESQEFSHDLDQAVSDLDQLGSK